MDYKSEFKERLSKLLFLEVDWNGFKRNVNIPSNISIKTEDLYIPISSKYLASHAGDELRLNNLPIYYFIEGMLIALGADDSLRYSEDYIIVLNNIKESEDCGKALVAAKIKEDNFIEAYLLIKGLCIATGNEEYYKKLLLVGEALKEKDKGFTDILLSDIESCKVEFSDMSDPYLYKTLILKEKGDFEAAKVEIHEYINKGGEVTKQVEEILKDIDNVTTYDKAIELLDESPEKSIGMLLGLLDNFQKNPLIYYYIAVGYRKLENYEKAIYYLNESLSIDSGILEVVNEMGVNYACLGDFEQALAYFKKAFEAAKDVESCTNIIMCYLNMGNEEQAKLHLDIAKKIKPDDEIVQQIDRMFAK